jgi:hypothetical protein
MKATHHRAAVSVSKEFESEKNVSRGGNEICEQDRQCTYNVTLRRVHVTNVAVEEQ